MPSEQVTEMRIQMLLMLAWYVCHVIDFYLFVFVLMVKLVSE